MPPSGPSRAIRVLFVCMGNICRSPTAEGVFRGLVAAAGLEDRFEIDSAGTIRYHQGRAPDRRALEAAARRGYDLSALRARQVDPGDFERFDYVLAMDRDNLRYLKESSHARYHERIRLLLDFAEAAGDESEVPDPYHGGAAGFENVLDLVESASRGLLDHIRAHDLKAS